MPILTGQQILAADVNNLVTIVNKTADETVNNSNVLQDDDELLFALAANEIWTGRAFLLFTSSSTDADIKFRFTAPALGAVYTAGTYKATATGVITLISGVGALVPYQGNDANVVLAILEFTVVNGANAGDLQLQWAQNTAKAADTKVLIGSHLELHKIA